MTLTRGAPSGANHLLVHRTMSHSPRLVVAALVACASAFTGSIDAEDRPATSLPYTPGLDVSAMDRSVNPCQDFYAFSCGGWQRNNPIPADQASWSVYAKAAQDNQRYLWGLLEEAAKPDAKRSVPQQQIGDLFASCMDESRIDELKVKPIAADLARIEGLASKWEIGPLLADLHARTGSSGFFFAPTSQQDDKESSRVIGALYAGGLGLPDRDYYTKQDPKSQEIRQRYVEHVAKIFGLLGETPERARALAATVMRIETALAEATLTLVDSRDPYKTYHRTNARQLRRLAPSIDWAAYGDAVGLSYEPWINVSQPRQLRQVDQLIRRESLPDLKAYLRWALVNESAERLGRQLFDADFAFYRAYLRGIPQPPPRWKTCVDDVDTLLGEALGKEFVERNFPPEAREKVSRMVQQVQAAMRVRIEQLDWMSPATKQQALEKLGKMANKIGYPQRWRDYSSIRIERDDYFGNVARATLFETRREMAKIGKPVDRDEWFMTPATVNAYYDQSRNDMNFPAGVLMPPLFDMKIDAAPGYGNTGGTIGHELTHGFDDQGRKYDGDGNLRDWWTRADARRFEERAQCVRDQYSQYVIVDDIRINGDLSSGEDIADLGGLLLAWMAWKEETRGEQLEPRDGLTPEQRFFVGYAQWACGDYRPEELRLNAATSPHSPLKYRVNGLLENIPEFARAFSCKTGDAHYKPPEKICRVW